MVSSLDPGDYIRIVLATLAVALVGMLPVVANKLLFDRIIPSGDTGLILPICSLLLGAAIASMLIGVLRTLVTARLTSKLSMQMEAAMMARLFMLPASFFKDRQAGDLAKRIRRVRDIVDVLTEKGRYLGSGYINDHSKIRVRIISKNPNDKFDEAFYRRRIDYALDYRETVMGADFSSCRLIFGEADSFPGLTVDKFENILVAQVLSLGIDRIKDLIFRNLVDSLRLRGHRIDAIYERNDVKVRALEGLDEYTGFYPMEGLRTDLSGEVEITENGIRYIVDYIGGQKTGFFLDQKYNRRAVAKIAAGMFTAASIRLAPTSSSPLINAISKMNARRRSSKPPAA
jgi:hypothetical protein